MGYSMNKEKLMPKPATGVYRGRGRFGETSLPVQTLRLAYQKMNAEGREALDKIVGQLAEVHSANKELMANSR